LLHEFIIVKGDLVFVLVRFHLFVLKLEETHHVADVSIQLLDQLFVDSSNLAFSVVKGSGLLDDFLEDFLTGLLLVDHVATTTEIKIVNNFSIELASVSRVDITAKVIIVTVTNLIFEVVVPLEQLALVSEAHESLTVLGVARVRQVELGTLARRAEGSCGGSLGLVPLLFQVS